MTLSRREDVSEAEGVSGYPEPYNLGRGQLHFRALGDAGGLTQFGAAVERLAPGGRSSQTHWHEREDEFLYLLEGELTVIEGDTETVIGPGDAACWKAGDPVGHSLRNDSDRPAVYIIVGSRNARDVCHYPGLDMVLTPEGFTHLDGTPYPRKGPR